MRCANYYRVSTKLQETKYSLKAQKQELTKYVENQGWELVGEFKDVESGGKLEKEGLNALMDMVEEGLIDVVLCIDQDRLSRLDTVAWEFLKSNLRDNNVKIAEPGSVTDLTNEDEEFISDIKNIIAKREKRAIVKRMMRGKRQRTREGKGWGKPPMEYNYDKNTGSYSLNEQWSWLIPFIDDLYLNKGLSHQSIAKELNKICKTPRGKNWSDVHVRKKLSNKAYHGIMEKTFSNGETITVENIYPALRTAEQYETIQEVRKKKFRRRKEETPQMLRRTHLTCGYCGRKMTTHMSGNKEYSIHFYITHSKPELQSDQSVCRLSINMIRVEKNIITAIKDIITSEDLAKKHVKMDYDKSDVKKLETEVKNAKKLVADGNEKIDRLLPLYLDGKFPKEQLDKQHDILKKEVRGHENRLKQLEAKLTVVKNQAFSYDLIFSYLAVAERFDVMLTQEEQMEMIGKLFPKGIVYEDHLKLTGTLPNDVPLEITVPVDPNPYENRYVNYQSNRDAWGKYQKIQEMMNENPGMPQSEIAKNLNIAPSTIVRLRNKFGEFENQIKAIDHDPEGKKEKVEAYLKENPTASIRQISRDTGVSTTSVVRVKKKIGL